MDSNRLIKRSRRGDREAFSELFTSAENEIYRIAYIYVKNREDALDIVQETAYRCFKNVGTLRVGDYFKTWAVRIAINCALDHLKKSGRTVSLEEVGTFEEAGEDLERAVIAKITLEDILELLDADEKSVILLKHRYGYTFAEIAAIMEIPLGTAKSVFYRAISKLKCKEDCL